MALTVLTVDDSKTIRMIVKKAFRPYDCKVLDAENGVEGLAMANRERPDLIVLDITMPVMNGIEMLKNYLRIHSVWSTDICVRESVRVRQWITVDSST